MSNNIWTASSIILTSKDINLTDSNTTTIFEALDNKAVRFSNNSLETIYGHIENNNGIVEIISSDETNNIVNMVKVSDSGIFLSYVDGTSEYELTLGENGIFANGSELLTNAKIDATADFTTSSLTSQIPTKGAVAAYVSNANLTSKAYVDEEIQKAVNGLVNGAPGTLDTLKEVADALAANDNVVNALNAAIGTKVDIASQNSGETMVSRITNKDGEVTIVSTEDIEFSGDATNSLLGITKSEIVLVNRNGSVAEHSLSVSESGVYVDSSLVLSQANVSTTFNKDGTNLPNETAIYNYLTSNYYNKNHINTNYVSNTTLTQKLAEKATIYFSEDNASGIPTNAAPGDFWIATTGSSQV